jgi:hypothetical protein
MYNSGWYRPSAAVCPKDQDTYIIGGGIIYTLGLPYADKLDITRVHHSFEADTYFQISILKFGNFLILCLIVKTIIICMIYLQTFLRK